MTTSVTDRMYNPSTDQPIYLFYRKNDFMYMAVKDNFLPSRFRVRDYNFLLTFVLQ